MELLAFVHNSVNYEDPTPDPEVRLPDISLKVPKSTGIAIAGVAMAMAAVGASSGSAFAANAPIGAGNSGDAVSSVQKALGIQADGQFGGKTQTAVMDFQIRQGLKEVDGVVGKETALALGLDEKYRPTDLGYVDTNSGIGLNVREGPGINYRRIGGLSEGTVVETFGDEVQRYYNWQQIDSGAWVATDYLSSYDYEPRGYDSSCHSDCDNGYRDYGYRENDYHDYGYQESDCHSYDYRESDYSDCGEHDRPHYREYGYRDRGGYDDCYEPVSYYDGCDHEDYYRPYAYDDCDHHEYGYREYSYRGHGSHHSDCGCN